MPPVELDAAKTLGIEPTASPGAMKSAFYKKIQGKHGVEKQNICLAYDMMQSRDNKECDRYGQTSPGVFQVLIEDVHYHAVMGNADKVREMTKAYPELKTRQDKQGRTLLYMAARNGHILLSKYIMQDGGHVNATQCNKSTALHAAAYFGHEGVISVLLEHGADSTMKNEWDQTPADGTHSESIKRIIATYKDDIVIALFNRLQRDNLADVLTPICDPTDAKRVIARRIRLSTFDGSRYTGWVSAYHGTKERNLEPIARNGLRAAGSKLSDGSVLRTADGHISLGRIVGGIKNWAGAIFVSPSIFYAGHVVYAERIMANGKRWCCMLECLVRPHSYTDHPHTVIAKQNVPGEPDNVEYRVPAHDDDRILRVDDKANIVIVAVVFVLVDFLESAETFDDCKVITKAEELEHLTRSMGAVSVKA